MHLATLAGLIGRPIAVLDLEHTGTKQPFYGILDLSIQVYGFNKEHKSFSVLLNPNQPINPYAQRVHGITKTMIKNAPGYITVAEQVQWVFRHCLVIGYNSNSCDIPILTESAEHCGKPLCSRTPTLDLMKVWQRVSQQKKGKLAEVAARYCVQQQHAHTAYGDALMTADTLSRMIAFHGIEVIFQGNELLPEIKRSLRLQAEIKQAETARKIAQRQKAEAQQQEAKAQQHTSKPQQSRQSEGFWSRMKARLTAGRPQQAA